MLGLLTSCFVSAGWVCSYVFGGKIGTVDRSDSDQLCGGYASVRLQHIIPLFVAN
jgi:hypothetical protein